MNFPSWWWGWGRSATWKKIPLYPVFLIGLPPYYTRIFGCSRLSTALVAAVSWCGHWSNNSWQLFFFCKRRIAPENKQWTLGIRFQRLREHKLAAERSELIPPSVSPTCDCTSILIFLFTRGDFGVSCKLRTFLKTFIQEEAFRHTWLDHFTSCLKQGTWFWGER